jgi:hypothetical protein
MDYNGLALLITALGGIEFIKYIGSVIKTRREQRKEAQRDAVTTDQWNQVLAHIDTLRKNFEKNEKADESRFRQTRQKLMRLELLNMIQHSPENKNAIMSLYDQYKRIGGNSYIKEIYTDWKERNNTKK